MQFILTFSAIYILGALIGQNMRIFIREPKLIHIKSPIIYTFLTFPVCVIAGKAVLAKNQKLMLSELMCCIFNQIVLVGTVILQVIPPVPCEVIELTFGLRHQGLDIVLDTQEKNTISNQFSHYILRKKRDARIPLLISFYNFNRR